MRLDIGLEIGLGIGIDIGPDIGLNDATMIPGWCLNDIKRMPG